MNVKQVLWRFSAYFYFFLWGGLMGASGQGNVDFSGVITKYDSTFSGIGPEVYFLPPPKTEAELLDDRYEEKEVDSALVEEYVKRMQYYHRLEMTGNGDVAAKYVPIRESQVASVEGKLLMAVDYNLASNNLNALADIQNRLAMEYVAIGTLEYAIEFFEKAIWTKKAVNNMADWETISNNLAVTYEYLGQLDKAYTLREELYERAVKSRDNRDQANTLMKLALIKAKRGGWSEAERDIIRKVVPLFRRARDEAGRASAYSTLAAIYTLQHKYPEAQWFLVQAKTIVDREGIAEQLPEIMFHLAETKKYAGNPSVAIEEYKVASNLAKKDHRIGMQLAIQDALGNLYHEAGDYDGAALALNQYDTLKNMLFKGVAPVDN
ncbi:tetratricopeptide repeat protein [Parapedobacter sp. 10938]|uniref:tetratricopeptide repeat protein n=1 Tax=Parapedobacter flavus TaxID=3110225 RepID=UPI002DB6B10F|nr:tetratricopeptide repeat protein [Parapedobacter sp. 10938]MEC3879243.1 tetratricopeptide repeat protein [Parapedobacter sp. 10938]